MPTPPHLTHAPNHRPSTRPSARPAPLAFAARRPSSSLAIIGALVSLAALSGCKPHGDKVKLGPFEVERFEEKSAEGARLDCYLFGGDSNKPARLCGEGQPTPGFSGYFFNAVAPAPYGKFAEKIGEPSPPGWYIVRPVGTSGVDSWSLGRLPTREWLANGKALLAVETTADHHTRVRLIDPQTRSDRVFDAGLTRADAYLLVRAPDDAHLLLVQRLGGEEMILIRDPLGNPELFITNTSDDKSLPGNKRFYKRGDLMRQNGGKFIPNSADFANFSWKGDSPLYEGAAMGPFDPPRT